MHKLNFDFQIKKESQGIFLEGFANPATKDRSKELLDPKSWKLDNYKKNPIILFDHGQDTYFGSMPIGKAVTIEPRDDGLYAKVKISDSKTERLTAIRDLVEEGILKTFSVGFKPGESSSDGDGKVIKNNELLEISVVPIPMHQDALGSLSLSEKRTKLAKKWVKKYQADCQKKIVETSKEAMGCDKIELVNVIVEKNGYETFEKASTFLKQYGYCVDKFNQTDTLFIFQQKSVDIEAKTFDVKLAPYITAQLKGEPMADKEKPIDDKEKEPKPSDSEIETEDGKKKDMEPDIKQLGPMIVQSIIFDKEKFSKEEAQKWAADHEYTSEGVDETEESLRLRQKQPGDFDPDSFRVMEIKPGIKLVMGKIKEEEKACKPEDEEKEKSQTDISTKAELPPAPTPTAPIPTGSAATAPDSNPLLDLQKQTNVLLGALISEIQRLNQQVEKIANPPKEDYEREQETVPQAPIIEDSGLQKSINAIRKNQEDLSRRLKKFA